MFLQQRIVQELMPTLRNGLPALLFFFALGASSQFCIADSNSILGDTARVRAADGIIALGTQIHTTALDCSHFVNSIFQQAGLYYKYEPSRVLYRGTAAFRRVYRPQPGDLIVWPGHVGIVVDPEHTTFISALRRGVRISSYTSRYWRRRGHARFLRYRFLPSDSPFVWEASTANASSSTFTNPGMQ
jgi:NlpC/P60 family protein